MMMSFLLLRRSCCRRRLLAFPAMPPLMRLPARNILRDAAAVTVTFLRGAMMMSFLVTVTFLRGAMMMSFLLLRRSCCGRRLLAFPAMPPLMRLPARPPKTRKQGSRQAQKMLYLNHMGIHASRPHVPCLAPPSINPCRNPCLVVWVSVWLKTFLDLSCRNTMVGVGCTNTITNNFCRLHALLPRCPPLPRPP